MLKRLFALLPVLALAACSTPVWVKDGATQQDFATDSYSCERDMRQSGYYGGGIFAIINAQDFEERCMVAHGWRQQGTAPLSGSSTSNPAPAGLSSYTQPPGTQPSVRPTLGIVGSTITSSSVAAIKMRDPHGVFVSTTAPSSAAARAGIQAGDVITSFNGMRVDSLEDLNRTVAAVAPGAEVSIGLDRKGRALEVPIRF